MRRGTTVGGAQGAHGAGAAALVCAEFRSMRSFFRKRACSPAVPTPQSWRRAAAEALRSSAATLGPLEARLIELLWAQQRPATVRDVQRAFPKRAYTTIMTTLDRLYRKGLLLRHKDGRAFAYAPRCSRAELLAELMSGHVFELLAAAGESTVLLSTLVRTVGRTDAALLDELDALVRAERLKRRGEGK